MTAGELVYLWNQRGGYDAEKRPVDIPTIGRPGRPIADRHHLTAEEFALPIAELEKRYPAPKLEDSK